LEPLNDGEPCPTVYDLYPQQIENGEPHNVSVSVGPSFKLASAKIPLAEISADISFGQVYPTVVGYTGENERAPYWDLRPTRTALIGVRDFWIIVSQPTGCTGICLRIRAEGELQTRFGPIAITPARRVWSERPHVVIQ
ncbi:MAG: hypothetical protein ACRDHP_15590, partial [Ktedonobacterales bacterium]